ncbi:hypothetical protein CLORY_08680 [Clostridium oryzae]|uniref:Uncharacterized protein n=1 Tax=Clostridium oryzae TaxID=1450648 RepID=A0A1V4IVM3_9CLOT|nr:hypothetical protein CLORY_08680 [Clostridium oryzae]
MSIKAYQNDFFYSVNKKFIPLTFGLLLFELKHVNLNNVNVIVFI